MNIRQSSFYLTLFTFLLFLSCHKTEGPNSCFTPDISSPFPGTQVQFTNCSSNSDRYEWSFGDGFTSTQANPTHAWQNPGNYLVTLKAINSEKSKSNSSQVQINVVATGNVTFWMDKNEIPYSLPYNVLVGSGFYFVSDSITLSYFSAPAFLAAGCASFTLPVVNNPYTAEIREDYSGTLIRTVTFSVTENTLMTINAH